MNKDVKQIRKSIAQRKATRPLNDKGAPYKQLPSVFPQDEEKHGYYPVLPETVHTPRNKRNRLISGMILKGLLSVLLFFGASILFQTDNPFFKKPTTWANSALTKEFPFARVNQWYQESFGSPMAFSPSKERGNTHNNELAMPVMGEISESFQTNGSGIMISPKATTNVSALREGVVIFAGNDRKTDKTVVVQHADGSKSIYGFLKTIDVHIYQFVHNNQQLGDFAPDKENQSVYFAIEKNNKFVDPVQVVEVDGLP